MTYINRGDSKRENKTNQNSRFKRHLRSSGDSVLRLNKPIKTHIIQAPCNY